VGLILLLLVACVAFAVGGTVGGLPGDLLGLLCLFGLLTRAGQVAPAEPPGRPMLQEGDQVAGLLVATGRLGQLLIVLFAPAGRQGKQPGLVAWRLLHQLL